MSITQSSFSDIIHTVYDDVNLYNLLSLTSFDILINFHQDTVG